MIAFACCVASQEKLARCAARGLQRVMESDSVFAETSTTESILVAYNEVLDHFAGVEDLEALVLLHEDLELQDDDFCTRIRTAFAEPNVAIVGAIGARYVRNLAWWKGQVAGTAAEPRGLVDGDQHDLVVDAVDGMLLVLSPWAVRTLRFDTDTFSGFHAYDIDLCFQAREAGRGIRVAPLSTFHHTKGGFGDEPAFQAANRAFVAKWYGGPAPRAEMPSFQAAR